MTDTRREFMTAAVADRSVVSRCADAFGAQIVAPQPTRPFGIVDLEGSCATARISTRRAVLRASACLRALRVSLSRFR